MYKGIRFEPISFAMLLKCEIIRTPNQHIRAKVYGYIQETENVLYRNWENEVTSIYETKENGEEGRLFCGMVDTLSVEEDGELKKLSIEAISFTARLDQKKRIRVFQNKNQTYADIVSFITDANKNAIHIFTESKSKSTDGMIVQYRESDWEFLIRIASYLNTVIVADCMSDKACFYFGLPQIGDMISLSSSRFKMKKNIVELEEKKGCGLFEGTVYL